MKHGSTNATGRSAKLGVQSLQFRGRRPRDREWKVDVSPYANVLHKPDHAIVSHWGREIKCVVGLEWTACNYGGVRAWFRCLNAGCRRRVAIVYSHNGDSFACRHCLDLAYASQQKCTKLRRLHCAQSIRMRLGGSSSLADPFPAKPKRMHRRTYVKLLRRALSYEEWFFSTVCRRLH